jgi:hypothetical protein
VRGRPGEGNPLIFRVWTMPRSTPQKSGAPRASVGEARRRGENERIAPGFRAVIVIPTRNCRRSWLESIVSGLPDFQALSARSRPHRSFKSKATAVGFGTRTAAGSGLHPLPGGGGLNTQSRP